MFSDKIQLKDLLEDIYRRYHSRDCIGDDPVVFPQSYENILDREVVALIAALMAYGRVSQIRMKVQKILKILGSFPYETLLSGNFKNKKNEILALKHRFTSGYQLFHLLQRLSDIIREHDSVGNFFERCWKEASFEVVYAIYLFRKHISCGLDNWGMFLPDPRKGGACKRWLLFLRWMVRRDEIDPGGWDFIKPSNLLIPLDVHMHRVALKLGFTVRKSSSMKTVFEITKALKCFDSHDPVRYDFSLTRWSMDNFRLD